MIQVLFSEIRVSALGDTPVLVLKEAAGPRQLAIWISAAAEVHDGTNTDPVNAFSGWYCHAYHNQVIATRLQEYAA